MKKRNLGIIFLFLTVNINILLYGTVASPWILGSLQYEGGFGNHPTPLYYEGNNITPSSNKQKTHFDFEIPRSRNHQIYYVIVVEQVIPVSKKSITGEVILNTIDYLKVPKETDYRLYQLHLESEIVTHHKGKTEKIYYWEVTEMILPENGQLPAQTLIIYDLPERVLSFESGGSLLSWPTLYMHTPSKHDQSFVDRLTQISFSVVDLNAIHIPIKKTIAHANDQKKVIIAFSS
ncbi:MAG TPA: hypothetical protein VL201_05885 [Patescibacteria group bacterium]|jgi:hypothetical protein|nr:hypothetical protein [Patescibacteria group bacterium]